MDRTKLYFHPAHEGTFAGVVEFMIFLQSHGYGAKEVDAELDGLLPVNDTVAIEYGDSVSGFIYKPWTDHEDDVSKTFHEFVGSQGAVLLDWSPYSTPTLGDALLWFDLRCPTRQVIGTTGPLRREDLEKFASIFEKKGA